MKQEKPEFLLIVMFHPAEHTARPSIISNEAMEEEEVSKKVAVGSFNHSAYVLTTVNYFSSKIASISVLPTHKATVKDHSNHWVLQPTGWRLFQMN